MKKRLLLLLFCLASFFAKAQKYYVYATTESESEVSLVSFNGKEAKTMHRIPIAYLPAEIEGLYDWHPSADGRQLYSLSTVNGELYETDARTLKLNRSLNLDLAAGYITEKELAEIKAAESEQEEQELGKANNDYQSTVQPAGLIPHPTERKVYVTAQGSDELLEVDLEKWTVTGRFKTGKGPYKVAVSPNGKYMVSTYKSEGYTGIWDLKSKQELVRIPNTRQVCHDVAISSDSKYAFVSVEDINEERGSVDVICLDELKKVDFTNIGRQARGVAFWKMED